MLFISSTSTLLAHGGLLPVVGMGFPAVTVNLDVSVAVGRNGIGDGADPSYEGLIVALAVVVLSCGSI